MSEHSLDTIVKRLGLALTTIDSAPVKLNALELNDVQGRIQDIYLILRE